MDRRFHRACALQFGTLRALRVIVSPVVALAGRLHGEPISFSFDATVVDVRAAAPRSSPSAHSHRNSELRDEIPRA